MVAIIRKKKGVTLLPKVGKRKRLVTVSLPSAGVKIQKKDGFTVGKLSHKVNGKTLKNALAEFP